MKQTWHVEKGKPDKNGDEVYFGARRFNNPEDAELYFSSLVLFPNETAYLEYSDDYTADILAFRRLC